MITSTFKDTGGFPAGRSKPPSASDNHFSSKQNHYVDGDDAPQFVFGYGLSYTTFKYDQLSVAAPAPGSADDVRVSFRLANTGNRAGDEVTQLYAHQTVASAVTDGRALKGFLRVHLAAGEMKQITLRLKQADLEIWGANQEWKVEPGEFTVTIGGNSNARLSAKFILKQAGP